MWLVLFHGASLSHEMHCFASKLFGTIHTEQVHPLVLARGFIPAAAKLNAVDVGLGALISRGASLSHEMQCFASKLFGTIHTEQVHPLVLARGFIPAAAKLNAVDVGLGALISRGASLSHEMQCFASKLFGTIHTEQVHPLAFAGGFIPAAAKLNAAVGTI